jgi:hypothetical protein
MPVVVLTKFPVCPVDNVVLVDQSGPAAWLEELPVPGRLQAVGE